MKIKKLIYLIVYGVLVLGCQEKTHNENIITSDIPLFWEAYDKIIKTNDTTLQKKYLEELYFNRASIGLDTIRKLRRYSVEDYLRVINKYPKFWESIRENTLSVNNYANDMQKGINNFKELYPDYKPAKVYFEIGAFRTPGTGIEGMLLIGAEMSMTDKKTVTSEFPKELDYFKNYIKNEPIKDLAFLNVHEYVHTQQNAYYGYDLLSQAVFEGSAEFIAEIAMNQASIQPSIKYGKKNEERVKELFIKEMFSPFIYHWFQNNPEDNEFGVRDLGYFMGYAIVKSYYEKATDKKKAIKDMIELDFTSQDAVESFVEQADYFEMPLKQYKELYEANRPMVIGFEGIKENQKDVSSEITQFVVQFNKPLQPPFASTNAGSRGYDYVPKINKIEFSEDGLSATYFVELKPNQEYEMIFGNGFRTNRAIPLKPYTLKFKTADN